MSKKSKRNERQNAKVNTVSNVIGNIIQTTIVHPQNATEMVVVVML